MLLNFYSTRNFALIVKKYGNQSLKTAKIEICRPQKSDFYFQYVPKTIGIKPTTFLSCMQNLVIGK